MFEVFVLAIALSMDAFAVSIGLGSKKVVNAEKLFIKAAAYFGFFQGFMPLLGYYSGAYSHDFDHRFSSALIA